MISAAWSPAGQVDGLLAVTQQFEDVVSAVQSALGQLSGTADPAWYPPVILKGIIDRSEYRGSFPHLLADVQVAGQPTQLVLAPAVCYHFYPRLRGQEIASPVQFDGSGYCYRHEATSEPGRLRSFRMREFALVGPGDLAAEWRDAGLETFASWLTGLGLKVDVQVANDPFFGPEARLMRASQRQQQLKYELRVPLHATDSGTAIASANCHGDHLGRRFGIALAGGEPAHSACVAFGIERIVLALIHAHGDHRADWPPITVNR